MGWIEITHKRSFKHVLRHKDLIGGIYDSTLKDSPLDLHHAVETWSKDYEQCGPHSGDNNRATTSFDTIKGND